MPLIVLGLIVIAGLLAYLHFSKADPEEIEEIMPKKKPEPAKEDEPAKVIVLPTDIEKEKKKRNIKTDN